jgi:hypothetical protein
MIIVIITRNRVFGGSKKKNPIGIGFLIHDFKHFHVSKDYKKTFIKTFIKVFFMLY